MAETKVQIPTVFVISPIGVVGSDEHQHARWVLDFIIKKALPSSAYSVVRADEEDSPDSISLQIVQRIVESDFIIAVLTDRNANVFYELAIAHGFNKPVVALMAEGQTPPFDVTDQRTIFYELTNPQSVDVAKERLQNSIEHLVGNTEAPRNPVTAFRSFAAIQRSSTPAEASEALAQTLNTVAHRLSRIEQRLEQSQVVSAYDAGVAAARYARYLPKEIPLTASLNVEPDVVKSARAKRRQAE